MGEMCCTTYNHVDTPNTTTCAGIGFPGNMSNMAMVGAADEQPHRRGQCGVWRRVRPVRPGLDQSSGLAGDGHHSRRRSFHRVKEDRVLRTVSLLSALGLRARCSIRLFAAGYEIAGLHATRRQGAAGAGSRAQSLAEREAAGNGAGDQPDGRSRGLQVEGRPEAQELRDSRRGVRDRAAVLQGPAHSDARDSPSKCSYAVVGIDPLWVYREEDYQNALGGGQVTRTRHCLCIGLASTIALSVGLGCSRKQRNEDFVPREEAALAALEAYMQAWSAGSTTQAVPDTSPAGYGCR